MQIQIQPFTVHKRFALRISRGTTTQTTNLWVRVASEGIEGWGEASPFSTGTTPQPTERSHQALIEIAPQLEAFEPWQRQEIGELLRSVKLPSAAQAAIDIALHDWQGKHLGIPLWKLWGLDRQRIVPTSLTVGISSPEAAKQRIRHWREVTPTQFLKIKLGNPEGIKADQAMMEAVREEAPEAQLSVDANAGWSLENAIAMCEWLTPFGVKYVEQPLPVAQKAQLKQLFAVSPLPIFVDESCWTSEDIYPLADRVHGINIKLMKSGGLSEALRMVHTAKACGLQVMFGCYSDSTLANTAAAQLAPLADYLDLDSHLNLIDNPVTGAVLTDGKIVPNDLPGLGLAPVVSE